MESLAEELRALGRAEGLDAVGVAPAEPFTRARRAIEERTAAGLHAGMAFTFKNPARSCDPGASVAGARALVVAALAYAADEPAAPEHPGGRVARYARTDSYAPLRRGLWVVARRLRAEGYRAVVFADDNSLVDREAAYLAGLGWYGKSANLLLPGRGSWFVLGSVVTDAPLPTGAIVAPGVVDARRCLAWLVQRAGSFPPEHRVALGDRLYGCDDCQEVCPPNRRGRGDGARPVADGAAFVELEWLLSATDDAIVERHGRWYLADRDPRWLRRNALVVLGNTADPTDPVARARLEAWAAGEDVILAEHARWALARLDDRAQVCEVT